jgi:Lipase (class 3)
MPTLKLQKLAATLMTLLTKVIIAGTILPAMMSIHTRTPIYTNSLTINWQHCHPVIPLPPAVTQHRLHAKKDPISEGDMRQPAHQPGFLNRLKQLIPSKKTQVIATAFNQSHVENHTDTHLENHIDKTTNINEIIAAKPNAFPAKNIETFLTTTLLSFHEAHHILCHLQHRPQNKNDIAFMRDMMQQFVGLQAKIIHVAHRYACDYWLPTLVQSITPKQINQLLEMASHDEEVAHWVSQFLVAIAYLSNSEFSAISTAFINKTQASGVMISPIYQATSEEKSPSTANLGYLLYAHNHIMLSLAGTQPCTLSQNLIAHLQFWKGENDLHQGYDQYTQSVIKPSLQPVLNQLMIDLQKMPYYHPSHPTKISYAGHSLGASIAAILAVEQWLAKEMNITPQQQALHINSAARIGGHQTHTQLQKNQIRLYSSTNEHDLVFKFPPQFFGFIPLTETQTVEPKNMWGELQHQISALHQNAKEAFVRHEITTTLFIAPPEKVVQFQQQMGLWTLPTATQPPNLLGYRSKL